MPRSAPWILLALLFAQNVSAGPGNGKDLSELSIEELLDVEVRTVSRRGEKWTEAAAAVFVITGDEIRRSGAKTLPEALRYVPGLQAAQINSSQWAISVRGFNSQYSNKTLVLIDGRSVYSPLTGGVAWEFQDLSLDDIERIEVVRGPGATLWGANAVNGVVNVITKAASATQGGLLRLGSGNLLERSLLLRWGGKLGNTAYRVWGKDLVHAEGETSSGDDAGDRWRVQRGGARIDSEMEFGRFSFELGAASGKIDYTSGAFESAPPFVVSRDGRLPFQQQTAIARFDREAGRSAWHCQLNLEHQNLSIDAFEEAHTQSELDFQHHWSSGGRHELVWGLDYRRSDDRFANSFETRFPEDTEPLEIFGAFVQDEIALGKSWTVTAGWKLEHINFARLESQPNLRLAYKPTATKTFWMAFSKAVRFRSRAELDLRQISQVFTLPDGQPLYVVIEGNHDLGTEKVNAYEAGFRWQPEPRFYLDLALFDFHYRNLFTLRQQTLRPDADFGALIFPLAIEPGAQSTSRGAEVNLIWQPVEGWRFDFGLSLLDMKTELARPDDVLVERSGANPQRQAFSRVRYSHRRFDADLGLRWVSDLPDLQIPSYLTLDLRLALKMKEGLSLILASHNLGERSHREFSGVTFGPTVPKAVLRDALLELEWRF